MDERAECVPEVIEPLTAHLIHFDGRSNQVELFKQAWLDFKQVRLAASSIHLYGDWPTVDERLHILENSIR